MIIFMCVCAFFFFLLPRILCFLAWHFSVSVHSPLFHHNIYQVRGTQQNGFLPQSLVFTQEPGLTLTSAKEMGMNPGEIQICNPN